MKLRDFVSMLTDTKFTTVPLLFKSKQEMELHVSESLVNRTCSVGCKCTCRLLYIPMKTRYMHRRLAILKVHSISLNE